MPYDTLNHGNPQPGESRVAAASPQVIKVWDLPTRIFHWLLALSFAGAYLSSESERYRDLHLMFGYTLAGLIGFRLLWGLIGTRYARFSSFAFGAGRLVDYLKSLATASPRHYVGHNPAGAIAIFLLLALGLATAASGFATDREIGGDWLAELHEGAAGIMLAVVAVHVAGVVVSSLLHRENLLRAMFTGDKRGNAAEAIGGTQRTVGILLLIAVLGLWTADRAGWLSVPSDNQALRQHHHQRD